MKGRISKLPLVKGNKLKEANGDLPKEKGVCCVGGRRREDNEMCEEKISSYVWEGVVKKKDMCKK